MIERGGQVRSIPSLAVSRALRKSQELRNRKAARERWWQELWSRLWLYGNPNAEEGGDGSKSAPGA
jgi:hypothetical protein